MTKGELCVCLDGAFSNDLEAAVVDESGAETPANKHWALN